MPLRSCTSSSWRFASSYCNPALCPGPAAQATCHHLSGGAPCHAHYLAYWIRPHMQTFIPSLGDSLHSEDISPALRDFSSLLFGVFGLPWVAVNSLGKVTCQALYVEFTSTLPHSKFKDRLPNLPWRIACCQLSHSSLTGLAADVIFSLFHSILSIQVHCHCLCLAPSRHCLYWPGSG